MTLPFEQDSWYTLIQLSGEGFTDYYLNIYGKDIINGGGKILLHTSDNCYLGEGDKFTIEYKIMVDYLFYNEAAKLMAGENNPLPAQIEFILELVVNSEGGKRRNPNRAGRGGRYPYGTLCTVHPQTNEPIGLF